MSTVSEIEQAIVKLRPADQRKLATWLEAHLTAAEFDPSVEEAWSAEIERRITELDSGQVQGVPVEQVFARARQVLDR